MVTADVRAEATTRLTNLQEAEGEARRNVEDAERSIRAEDADAARSKIQGLKDESGRDERESKRLIAEADVIATALRKSDEEHDLPAAIAKESIAVLVEEVRNTPVAADLPGQPRQPEDDSKTPVVPPPVAEMNARKYLVFDKSFDRVERIENSQRAMTEYEQVRKEYADVIAATTERLRRLWSPDKNKIKVNAEQGRLDPRNAARLGLALKGAPVDVSRIWKTITTRKDPRVAVTMLVDCSGSMGGKKISLAMKAACCLSEVMRALHIPHEIIGHTTDSDIGPILDSLAQCDETPRDFSRSVGFVGYSFKEFNENQAPTNIFGNFQMSENLDGEAVMWALERLQRRKEKTKICVVLSDGRPNACLSQVQELERHLYTVAKLAEAKEKEGMYLYGLSIAEERTREFYGNAEVLSKVEDLPKAVLSIVERVMERVEKRR
jgi:cobalamin biosynthesis protein CobT